MISIKCITMLHQHINLLTEKKVIFVYVIVFYLKTLMNIQIQILVSLCLIG